MSTGLDTYLRMHTGLDDDTIARIRESARPRTLRRNELLLQQGQVCRYKTFVQQGLLRTFGTDEAGVEHILQFAPELHWTLDAESYDRQEPARFSISAVEPSELFLWTKTDFDRLLTDIPVLAKFSQQLVSRNIHNSRHRLFSALSATPEEKYNEFVNTSPDLLARLPLHMIASYLGISLKTLTRIRHAQWHR
ncbi:Crp/Fnr family transcriptional regulator [Taibaiella chishuiensis]|uniref:CRP-like cAMP-binding protein n=1 Tax=Taibaiella chishuiensis TaxID=1434707 RepID=A0A2P8CXA4_9BACT|nr:Crp/Fnr family transcriptional regulator [Taibaiella chishuiensis]PSK89579.1 CRP-like cAMP-binding protein [Taibaiella chishuiensis]